MDKHDEEIVELKREELYESVWSTAMWKLAPTLGISDRGLHKLCKRLKIPTPPRGYWAKKEHGKAPRKPKLPRCDEQGLVEIKFYPNAPKLTSDIAEVGASKAGDDAWAKRIEVPATLDSPHPLVAETQQALTGAGTDEDGMLKPRTKRRLIVRVAPPSVDRALRIMDALLKALATRGLEVHLQKRDEHWSTVVTVRDEIIRFGMYEITRRIEREPTPSERRENERSSWRKPQRFFVDRPTGKLSLVVHSGPENGRIRSFTDSQRRPLDSLLKAFVATLYLTAQDIKDERARLEQQEKDRAEAARVIQEFEAQRAEKLKEIREEEEELAHLNTYAANWEHSQSMRRYIEAARRMVVARDGEVVSGSPIANWLVWATEQADRMDPLVKSPPSILEEKAKWERPAYW